MRLDSVLKPGRKVVADVAHAGKRYTIIAEWQGWSGGIGAHVKLKGGKEQRLIRDQAFSPDDTTSAFESAVRRMLAPDAVIDFHWGSRVVEAPKEDKLLGAIKRELRGVDYSISRDGEGYRVTLARPAADAAKLTGPTERLRRKKLNVGFDKRHMYIWP